MAWGRDQDDALKARIAAGGVDVAKADGCLKCGIGSGGKVSELMLGFVGCQHDYCPLRDYKNARAKEALEAKVPARRIRIDLITSAETACRNAMIEVEKMAGDVRLTDAVNLLSHARDSVADYLEGVEKRRVVVTVDGTAHPGLCGPLNTCAKPTEPAREAPLECCHINRLGVSCAELAEYELRRVHPKPEPYVVAHACRAHVVELLGDAVATEVVRLVEPGSRVPVFV